MKEILHYLGFALTAISLISGIYECNKINNVPPMPEKVLLDTAHHHNYTLKYYVNPVELSLQRVPSVAVFMAWHSREFPVKFFKSYMHVASHSIKDSVLTIALKASATSHQIDTFTVILPDTFVCA